MGVGAAVAGVGLIGSAVAGDRAAQAQGAASDAQLAEERARRDEVMKLAQPSPDELSQLQQSISLNTQDIARKQKLLDSADPALIEAGKQALDLLQGKESASLGPLKQQQARQEQQLRDRLQAQLGPGYENTTAGIQALSQLREQQNNNLVGAQQSTLGMLLGQTNNTEQMGNQQNNIANLMGFSQQYGSYQTRAINGINATPINPGLAYAGDIAGARNQQQTFGNLTSLGALFGLAGNGSSSPFVSGGSSSAASNASSSMLGSNTNLAGLYP